MLRFPVERTLTMATATINISIPDALKREVEEVIAAEGYGNTSEFFRDLVRKYLRQRRERHLETMLVAGIESGIATPLTPADFAAIQKRGLRRIKTQGEK
jgi:antitoxin ParD1/3/4